MDKKERQSLRETMQLWTSDDARAVCNEALRQLKVARKAANSPKANEERKAYFRGKVEGLKDSVKIARWFMDDVEQRGRL